MAVEECNAHHDRRADSVCGQVFWQQAARERGLAPQVPVPIPGQKARAQGPGQKGTGTSLRSEPVPICPGWSQHTAVKECGAHHDRRADFSRIVVGPHLDTMRRSPPIVEQPIEFFGRFAIRPFSHVYRKATAIVLRTVEFSETSLILTLFTREFGKVRGLAKGARRLKSAFESALDLLALCRIVFLRKSSEALDLLTEAKLLRRFRRQVGTCSACMLATTWPSCWAS